MCGRFTITTALYAAPIRDLHTPNLANYCLSAPSVWTLLLVAGDLRLVQSYIRLERYIRLVHTWLSLRHRTVKL